MVLVKSFSSPVISVPVSWAGSTAETSRVAIRATKASPKQTSRKFHRSRGRTDDNQRGFSPCRVRISSQVRGIVEARARLR